MPKLFNRQNHTIMTELELLSEIYRGETHADPSTVAPVVTTTPTGAPAGFPPNIPYATEKFLNWAWDINLPAITTATPRNEDDAVQLVNAAAATGYKVRVKGKGHNWSPLLIRNGADVSKTIFINTVNLSAAQFNANGGTPLATFGTGITVDAATLFLEQQNNVNPGGAPGYTFVNMTGPGALTLGGALAIGAHGTSVDAPGADTKGLGGCLSNLVVSFRAIVSDPASGKYVVKTFSRTDPDAAAFLVHLGRAFITQVTMRVVLNYYLQVSNVYPPRKVLFQAPAANLDPNAIQSLVNKFGRVEVIWFPGTFYPWVKTWQQFATAPGPLVPGPYNYRFANTITDPDNVVIRKVLSDAPGLTPLFQFVALSTARDAKNGSEFTKLNGTSRNLLHYVKDTTMRVTSFGYAIQINRNQVQQTAYDFFNKFHSLNESYQAKLKYPINSAVEMRYTTLDKVTNLGVDPTQAQAPLLSASALCDNTRTDLDTVFWLDILTIPGTKTCNDFFVELEAWVQSQWGSVIRPEWSKGWAYTANGPYTNDALIKNQVVGTYYKNTFASAKATLAKYDTANVYTNDFLDKLFG